MNQEPLQPQQQNQAMRNFGVERQWGQLIGTNIRTFDESRNLVCFAKQKAFKLKEEVTFYQDEAQSVPMFNVKARSVIDFGATYDILDLQGTRIGSLRRKGLVSSFVQDEWLILGSNDEEVGLIKEDNMMLALLRRYVDFVSLIVPQTYQITLNGSHVGTVTQRKNPFTVKYDYSIQARIYDEHTMLCTAIPNLLAIIESRQN